MKTSMKYLLMTAAASAMSFMAWTMVSPAFETITRLYQFYFINSGLASLL